MVRAPAFTYDLLSALRALVRLDFVRKLKVSLTQAVGQPVVESVNKQLKLVDHFTEHEQPILVAMALMEIHGGDECLIPLSEERFIYFDNLINNTTIDREQDFPNIPADQFESDIQPLRDAQGALRTMFKDAPFVNRDTIEEDLENGNLPSSTGKSFLN